MYLQENLEEVWSIRSHQECTYRRIWKRSGQYEVTKNVLTGESGRGLVNKKSPRMYLQENLEEVWSIRSHQECLHNIWPFYIADFY